MKVFRLLMVGATISIIGCAKQVRTFKVTWMNEDQVLKVDENVIEGTVPNYDGPTPEKINPSPLVKKYTFNGWDKEIVQINQDTIYNATFLESETAALAITFNSNEEHNNFAFTNLNTRVDWGDESNTSEEESSHTFTNDGEYVIRFYTNDLSSFKIDDGLGGVISLYFADFISKISQTGFKNCTSLKSVRLPNNLTNLNAYTFYNSKVDFYTKIDNVYYLGNEANNHLYCFGTTNEEEISIIEGCEVLTNNSFEQSTNTKNFSLPKSLKIIGDNTFESCNSLSSLLIPENVESIGECAFNKCYQLEGINIPSKVKLIRESCFENCSNLKSIVLPNSIDEIESCAFYSCVNLNFVDLSNIDHYLKGGQDMFVGCANDLRIKVKDVTLKAKYESEANWKNYTFIVD